MSGVFRARPRGSPTGTRLSRARARRGRRAFGRADAVPRAQGDATNVAPAKTAGKKSKTIEETYQKKTQLEHILLRPDTYSASPASLVASRARAAGRRRVRSRGAQSGRSR